MSCIRELNEEETISALAEHGLTPETTMQPTAFELENELKLEHITRRQYLAECRRYGYTPVPK